MSHTEKKTLDKLEMNTSPKAKSLHPPKDRKASWGASVEMARRQRRERQSQRLKYRSSR